MFAEKPLFQVQLPSSAAQLYTPDLAGGAALAKIMSLVIANSDSSVRTVFLYRVPPSGSASVATMIIPGVSMPAKKTWALTPLGILVPQGWSIWGSSDSANLVTVTADGGVWQS